ncbi:methyltransferase [Neptunicella sp. SCSIO 80796]|uniref:methyltransferase n=1 Tax=Neptunicella plasticusilytica TaxID=3117012 RepID=UPI003A4E4576
MKPHHKPDQSFDSIANKFQRNIYGTTKGQLRHELLLHYLDRYLPAESVNILEAGGGSGEMALALLERGHRVHVNDISADMLVLAQQQCSGYRGFSYQQGEIQQLDHQQYDVVICHAVLEWLQEPLAIIKKLKSLVKPAGILSLSFFNRDAHLFGNVLYGNFDYIDKDFAVGNRVRLNPNNAIAPKQVIAELERLSMPIVHQAGIRCFHDYVRDKAIQQSHYQQLKELELKWGKHEPYMWLGKYFHLIARQSS